MSEAMTMAGKVEEQMAQLGKDMSDRSGGITAAVERGDTAYLAALQTLYISKTKELNAQLEDLVRNMRPKED